MRNYVDEIKFFLKSEFGKKLEDASKQEITFALSKTIMTSISDRWDDSKKEYAKERDTYRLGHITKGVLRSSEVRALLGYLVKKGVLKIDDKKHIQNEEKEDEYFVIYEECAFGETIEKSDIWTAKYMAWNYEHKNIVKTIKVMPIP